jgi:hypothetical protein
MINIFRIGPKDEKEKQRLERFNVYKKVGIETKNMHSSLEKDQGTLIDQYIKKNKEGSLDEKIKRFEHELLRFEIQYKHATKVENKDYWSAVSKAIEHTTITDKKTRAYEALRLIQATDESLIITRWNRNIRDKDEVQKYIVGLKNREEKSLTNKEILKDIAHKYKHTMSLNTMYKYIHGTIL